ncbi:unnamed protein product [Schistocephalus solidus]|uniref:IstB_IS21 domain-containing protein n=1 Tax=Schistocephalus solidus TaxID=70667 RepID=A0A183T469_SCHSO|nr:unnamed protein product [Schistocephalus solidus]
MLLGYENYIRVLLGPEDLTRMCLSLDSMVVGILCGECSCGRLKLVPNYHLWLHVAGLFPVAAPRSNVTSGGLNRVRVSGAVWVSEPDTYHDEHPGICIAYRTDGHLLSIQRMQALTRVSTITIHDLLFVDECALNTGTEEDIKRRMDLFATGYANFGKAISTAKTRVICTNRSLTWNTIFHE